ncbi:MAG: hypothetical protein GX921_10745 [Bacteroidales bacterium]|nr:hypothetical protein [Bacteroidales bacterium]
MRKKVFVQFLKWFLPLLFITFINGKTLFIHSHLEKGSFVIHSHPFDKSETTTHDHTTKELIAIEFHTHGHSTTAIVPYVEINSPLQYLAHHNYSYEETVHLAQKNNSNLLRAPPFYS